MTNVNKIFLRTDVLKQKRRNLHRAIADFNITWNTLKPQVMIPIITKRYSHAAAVHKDSMYIFGGCTCSMTTFNDLWRFDLSQRQWIRPLTTGKYPSPKACSTMVCYKDLLGKDFNYVVQVTGEKYQICSFVRWLDMSPFLSLTSELAFI